MKRYFKPGSPFWIYQAIVCAISAVAGYHFLTGLPQWLMALAGFLLAILLNVFALGFMGLMAYLQARLNRRWVVGTLAFLASTWFIVENSFGLPSVAVYYLMGVGIAMGIGWFLGWYFLERKKYISANLSFYSVVIIAAAGLTYLFLPGTDETSEIPASGFYPEFTGKTEFEYSSLLRKGTHTVVEFTYGSGTDRNRPEYREGVKYTTSPVDGSLILPEWDSLSQEDREEFLGFGIGELPVNGRVYMPAEEGSFPLFLIVHGNHSMIDWSDDGYAYLGQHLASRGYIVVSVDENFLNGHWSGDFRGKELPARAWLLLKHLDQWKQWTSDEAHDLFGKVDWEQVFLAGHSRGGEAVQIASVFNELDRFPENGNLEFDFGYNIKGVISLAPTDYRYDRQVSMKDVNYLGIQGSYDSDESSFWGLRAYRRLTFSDSTDYFKAGVYIHRANHSQFNSTWGRADSGIPFAWFLNRGALLEPEEQREIALFFITAFVEKVTDRQPVPSEVFKNMNRVRNLLPGSYILTHYSNSGTKRVLDYSEDPDISREGDDMRLSGRDLLLWKETDLKSRGGGSLQNYAAVLGWYRDMTENGTEYPRYIIESGSTFFSDSLLSLTVTLGAGDYKELRKYLADSIKLSEPNYQVTLVLRDSLREVVEIPFSEVKKIPPRLETEFSKLESVNRNLGRWEVQTETWHFSRSLMLLHNQAFDPDRITRLSLQFDGNPYGVVVLDAVGVEEGR